MANKHLEKKLRGSWVLTERDGQTAWPTSRRFFTPHLYSWEDEGRPEGKRIQNGRVKYGDGRITTIGIDSATASEPVETYAVSVEGDTLHIQRIAPTVGRKSTYKRAE